jgi:hypothetical protein
MLPDVKILQPFTGAEAQQLVALCPKKVFDIEDMGSSVRARLFLLFIHFHLIYDL